MFRIIETKVTKRRLLWCKKIINNWDNNVGKRVISKLVEIKTNSKYLIRYLDKVTRTLVLILPQTSGYYKIFKVKDRDKGKNNKSMYQKSTKHLE